MRIRLKKLFLFVEIPRLVGRWCENFEVYQLLPPHGFKFHPDENFDEVMDTNPLVSCETKSLRVWLREIHKKYVKESTWKNRLSHSTDDVNEISEIEPMLKFVSAAKGLQIFFDFGRDSVEHMDPTSSFLARLTQPNIAFILAQRVCSMTLVSMTCVELWLMSWHTSRPECCLATNANRTELTTKSEN